MYYRGDANILAATSMVPTEDLSDEIKIPALEFCGVLNV